MYISVLNKPYDFDFGSPKVHLCEAGSASSPKVHLCEAGSASSPKVHLCEAASALLKKIIHSIIVAKKIFGNVY